MTFDEFARQGRFGCGACYATFRQRLEPIMRKIHGASLHRGRNPGMITAEGETNQALPIKEEERLDSELKKAIESEDFERAAELRDKLKAVRLSMSVED
jgi:protein arginine kinase activator